MLLAVGLGFFIWRRRSRGAGKRPPSCTGSSSKCNEAKKNKTITKRTILYFAGIMVEFNSKSEVTVKDDANERSNAVFDGR